MTTEGAQMILIMFVIISILLALVFYEQGRITGMKSMQNMYKPLLDSYDKAMLQIAKIVKELEK